MYEVWILHRTGLKPFHYSHIHEAIGIQSGNCKGVCDLLFCRLCCWPPVVDFLDHSHISYSTDRLARLYISASRCSTLEATSPSVRWVSCWRNPGPTRSSGNPRSYFPRNNATVKCKTHTLQYMNLLLGISSHYGTQQFKLHSWD